jgi:hypothetical protein
LPSRVGGRTLGMTMKRTRHRLLTMLGIEIPAIGMRALTFRLGLNPDRSLEVVV